MRRLVLLVVFALLGVATSQCGGNVTMDGRPCPCAEGYLCCAENVCVAPGGACPRDGAGGSGLQVTPATIHALCTAARGAVIPPPRTAAAMTRVVARRWYVCGHDPASWSPLLVRAGIEFKPDGSWTFIDRRSDDTYTVAAVSDGTWGIYHDTLNRVVGPGDTTPGYAPYVRWFDDALEGFHGGALDLRMDFERSPFRFRTEKGIDTWFVALDESGAELEGTEGMACPEGGPPCRDGARCIYERNARSCSKPAVVGLGEGCDRSETRTCAAGLYCLESRRCGEAHGAGEPCDGELLGCSDPLRCDESGRCAP
jgi:hypothetical protein